VRSPKRAGPAEPPVPKLNLRGLLAREAALELETEAQNEERVSYAIGAVRYCADLVVSLPVCATGGQLGSKHNYLFSHRITTLRGTGPNTGHALRASIGRVLGFLRLYYHLVTCCFPFLLFFSSQP